jgi:parvulin-like peptidyl-prolyl isomerase
LLVTVKEMDLTRTLVEKQITPGIAVTAEEITAFHSENPGMFSTPEQVHARHILFTVDQNADADTIITARASADSARERALAGEDFAELARELSQDPSAPEGGDLGFFTYQQMPTVFADAAFALQAGGISEVVRTSYGFHVIKVEEKKPAASSTLEESSPRIRQLLTQKKIGEQVQELLKSLGEAATIVPLVAPEGSADEPAGQPTPE